jgi:hypothetical protein
MTRPPTEPKPMTREGELLLKALLADIIARGGKA